MSIFADPNIKYEKDLISARKAALGLPIGDYEAPIMKVKSIKQYRNSS